MPKAVKSSDGRTISPWLAGVKLPAHDPLTRNEEADVCVIGAGIAGLTAAYLLLREGRSVIILDDRPVGDGQTGRTSAHLASVIDDRFCEIRRMHGEEVAKVCYRSHNAAIDQIEAITNRHGIECDLARLDGYLFLHEGETPEILERELAAAQLAGVVGVQKLDRAPVEGFDSGPCLRFGRQGRFHPLKYLVGLCREIERMGGRVFCGNRVIDAQGADREKDECCESRTQHGPIVRSRATVVATNTPAPINNWAGIYTKQAAYRTYVIALRLPRGSLTDALYWDTGDPYHYIRVDSSSDASHDTLLVGGEDHKTGHHDPSAAPFAALEAWTRRHFPQAGGVTHRWSGQVQEPNDGIAFIGRAPTKKPNVYVITGDSGMGLTHGTLGAMIVCDQIMGRANPWEAVYDPSRKPTKAMGEFIRENLDAATTFKDYVTSGEVQSEAEIAPGSGAVMREGLLKLAVYRDEQGKVYKQSAICTHLGCIVQWNHVEKSWDCPCHGSRFQPHGKVILGPAVSDLPPRDV